MADLLDWVLVVGPLFVLYLHVDGEPAYFLGTGVLLFPVLLLLVVARHRADVATADGASTDGANEASASADADDASATDVDAIVRCSGCGVAVPAGTDRCDDCETVGTWRK